MTILEAIEARHAVRQYEDIPISEEIVSELNEEIAKCNEEGQLHIQLVTNEPTAFGKGMVRKHITGCVNYIAIAGPNDEHLADRGGYYGERIALKAQTLELNTCWVYMSVSKKAVKKNIQLNDGEKLSMVIALGYGTTQGEAHKSKTYDKVVRGSEDAPEWFKAGIEAVLLAPTAMNQQKFSFKYDNGIVTVRPGTGPCVLTDLGIAIYHFEIGSGKPNVIRP